MTIDIAALYCCRDDFRMLFEEWEAHRLIPSQTAGKRPGKLPAVRNTVHHGPVSPLAVKGLVADHIAGLHAGTARTTAPLARSLRHVMENQKLCGGNARSFQAAALPSGFPAEYYPARDFGSPVTEGSTARDRAGSQHMSITRRESLVLASAAMASSSIPNITARAAVTDVPTADVKPLDYKLEKGAELRVLRPAKFIDPDEVYWRENTRKYTEATGVPVRVDYLSWEDIRPPDRRRRQYRRRPRHRPGLQLRSADLRQQDRRHDRPCRLPRRQIRRLAATCRTLRHQMENEGVDIHPRRRRHRTGGVSPVLGEGSWIRYHPGRSPGLPDPLSKPEENRPPLRLRARACPRRRQRIRILAAMVAQRHAGG